MTKGKNCPNCGAIIDKDVDKCAYCGTSYFDLTAIDLEENKPFFLKLKINNCILTGKCILRFGAFTIEEDVVSAYGGAPWSPSTKLLNFTRSRNVNLDTNFEIVPDDKGNLITMVVEE